MERGEGVGCQLQVDWTTHWAPDVPAPALVPVRCIEAVTAMRAWRQQEQVLLLLTAAVPELESEEEEEEVDQLSQS